MKEEDSTNNGLSRAEARIDFPALRGAEAPLFHGAARVLLVLRKIVLCKIKIGVKGVGPFGFAQGRPECPTHTSNPGSQEIPTGLFFSMFR